MTKRVACGRSDGNSKSQKPYLLSLGHFSLFSLPRGPNRFSAIFIRFWSRGPNFTNPGTTPIAILAVNSGHGLSFAGEATRTMLSEFPFLYRFTVLLNSGGSNSPWSEFWSEFPHFMGMGVVPAPSKNHRSHRHCGSS